MNRHFEDARYYLGRTVESAAKGAYYELRPVVGRAKEAVGEEPEPEPEGFDAVKADVETMRDRAAHEVSATVDSARERIAAYRA
jgi:hypothetical protein